MLTATLLLTLSAHAGGSDDLAHLVEEAPNVIRGQVVRAQTFRKGTTFQTHYTVAVFQVYQGDAPEMFSMWLPGGTRNGVTWYPAGVPGWEEGEDVVMFMRDDGQTPYDGMFTLEHGVLLDGAGQRAITLTDLLAQTWANEDESRLTAIAGHSPTEVAP